MGEQLASFEARLEQGRRQFFEGGQSPAGLVSPPVIRSWERSLAYGLQTGDARVMNPVSREQTQAVTERNHRLVACALPEMERLRTMMARGHWGIVCTDPDGRVVKSLCGTGTSFDGLNQIFQVGRSILEADIGTNGLGCALIERQPIVIRAAEHFLDEIRPFACASVPLFDPAGQLAGILDATRYCDGSPITVLEPLAIAARAIENRMLDDLGGSLRLCFHTRPELLATPLAGVMVFDDAGQLLGANQAARQLLHLVPERDSSPGFSQLFDCPAETFNQALSGRITQGTLWNDDGLGFEARFEARDRSTLMARIGNAVRTLRNTDDSRPATSPLGAGMDGPAGRALHIARRAFERDIPVLINGETGTGKEVLARRLHDESDRAAGPFVAINCSSLPAGLIESEFFGYEDGAFTGGRRGGAPGKFELARGGTLFLDEIGDMPLELQGRLLRVLQERNFTRLGGARPIRFDARIITATHRSLEERVAEGLFREDLYYRIKGVKVCLPALRDRDDRAALITSMLAREAGTATAAPRLSADATHILMHYPWPGNIRQLGHVLRLALTLAEDDTEIRPEHLPEELLERETFQAPQTTTRPDVRNMCLRELELEAVRAAMTRSGGNVSAAARSLKVARATLYRKLKQFGMLS
ncbi:sigma-54-dependent Fis family transcriptional regulator [Zoogloea sp.]|uniref:sigma-54-dependent Fis family transcriptional regulator n=1 Tax=Zoogloea sp. TaxID=49181 RepID=UPI0025EFFFD6|nr:sigma-54-dependent Fis family transcriptional regulator [Zoogloea sp.]MCK6393476.1 sigma-54-dependent Fis family transcriptional regulator [Zoogloea sp.]